MLFAGVDGGQSSTVAVVGDEGGELGRGTGPPADLVGEPRDSRRQAEAVGVALDAARSAAGLAQGDRLAALVAGISGFDRGESPEPDLAALAERTSVVHDSAIAHAGALDGAPGIVVIAGTGSVALGNASPGETLVRAGGWGYFFGDGGSAMWIARRAIGTAMRAEDRGATSDLRERALAYYGAVSLRAIQHAFAHGDIGRPALAAFASEVLESAAAGDPYARAVVAEASTQLAALVETIDERLGPCGTRAVSYAGGLFADASFIVRFRAATAAAAKHAEVVAPAHDPATGALILARALVRSGTP